MMRKDLIEDELRRPLGAWIGALFGAVVATVVWIAVVLFADVPATRIGAVVVVSFGAVGGGVLGWCFPKPVRAIGSFFLQFVP